MSDPRLVALRFLLDVEQGRHVDQLTLSPSFSELAAPDRGLARELVYGCLRHLRLLDFGLQQHSSRRLSRLDPAVRWLLRLGAYQLSHLRVPEHAAVDTSVSLCRRAGFRSASGYVNAVLRNLIRQPVSPPPGSDADSLAIRYSHPTWLVERYLQRWGAEIAAQVLTQNNLPPAPLFWVNPKRGSPESLLLELGRQGHSGGLHPELEDCIEVPAAAVAGLAACPERGFFMDEGSQRVVRRRVPAGARRLVDLCAAPGGKTFLLETQRRPEAMLVSCDLSLSRLDQIRERSRRLGISGLNLLQCDSSEPPFRPRSFDFLLLDVPCSGLGTVRSNPDIRWRISESDLTGFHHRQCALLRAALRLLAGDGRLVYATCSTEPEENEEVLEKTLADWPEPLEISAMERNFPGECLGDSFFWAEVGRISPPRRDAAGQGRV